MKALTTNLLTYTLKNAFWSSGLRVLHIKVQTLVGRRGRKNRRKLRNIEAGTLSFLENTIPILHKSKMDTVKELA